MFSKLSSKLGDEVNAVHRSCLHWPSEQVLFPSELLWLWALVAMSPQWFWSSQQCYSCGKDKVWLHQVINSLTRYLILHQFISTSERRWSCHFLQIGWVNKMYVIFLAHTKDIVAPPACMTQPQPVGRSFVYPALKQVCSHGLFWLMCEYLIIHKHILIFIFF